MIFSSRKDGMGGLACRQPAPGERVQGLAVAWLDLQDCLEMDDRVLVHAPVDQPLGQGEAVRDRRRAFDAVAQLIERQLPAPRPRRCPAADPAMASCGA